MAPRVVETCTVVASPCSVTVLAVAGTTTSCIAVAAQNGHAIPCRTALRTPPAAPAAAPAAVRRPRPVARPAAGCRTPCAESEGSTHFAEAGRRHSGSHAISMQGSSLGGVLATHRPSAECPSLVPPHLCVFRNWKWLPAGHAAAGVADSCFSSAALWPLLT
jgi:hypothetical protein